MVASGKFWTPQPRETRESQQPLGLSACEGKGLWDTQKEQGCPESHTAQSLQTCNKVNPLAHRRMVYMFVCHDDAIYTLTKEPSVPLLLTRTRWGVIHFPVSVGDTSRKHWKPKHSCRPSAWAASCSSQGTDRDRPGGRSLEASLHGPSLPAASGGLFSGTQKKQYLEPIIKKFAFL